MRLLLDEHFSPGIARQLRKRGHDVIAVGDQPDLRGRSDRVHFASQPSQKRAIVTRDLGDFRPLLRDALRAGTQTYGLVCVPNRFSLSKKHIGRLVRALEALLKEHPDDDAAIRCGGELWLEGPAGKSSPSNTRSVSEGGLEPPRPCDH